MNEQHKLRADYQTEIDVPEIIQERDTQWILIIPHHEQFSEHLNRKMFIVDHLNNGFLK